jgi:hypothetical protein
MSLAFSKISHIVFKHPVRKYNGHEPLKEEVINIKWKLHTSETEILSSWL